MPQVTTDHAQTAPLATSESGDLLLKVACQLHAHSIGPMGSVFFETGTPCFLEGG